MNKNVIISISGWQLTENFEGEMLELITDGELAREGNLYSITYKESELTGLEGTTTVLEIDSDRVILSRSGNVDSQLVFEQGKKHMGFYETMFGAFTVGVSTRRISSTLQDSGGNLEIDYTVEVDHALAGQNNIKMSVREAN